jgi:hypothetical protein
MKLIGYWIRSLEDPDFIPPQELVGPLPDHQRRALADYLDRGRHFEQYRGTSWCRFGCDHEMGSSELSDGLWVWPVDLGHYVRDHGVLLPNEFVRHALTSPAAGASEWSPDAVPDEEFWKQWCRSHRSGLYLLKLAHARQLADANSRRLTEEAALALEAKEGVASVRCQWIGCNDRALARRALCA